MRIDKARQDIFAAGIDDFCSVRRGRVGHSAFARTAYIGNTIVQYEYIHGAARRRAGAID